MRVAYLDCFSGISGDMFLGALLDAGFPAEALEDIYAALGLDGISLHQQQLLVQGISAVRVDIQCAEGHHHRGLKEITVILEQAQLAPEVRNGALRVFSKLAQAEAAVHGTSVDAVHFHEVGALDAIADIVGCVAGVQHLGIERLVCSPLPMPRGWVQAAHGFLPLPAPAVLRLLEGMPVYGLNLSQELITPTGAALVAGLVDEFGPMPAMQLEGSGHGAGSMEREDGRPNLLRLVIGTGEQVETADYVDVLETHIDDWNPEFWPYVSERLMASGALDVCLIPMQMKKGRPGFLLRVLCETAQRQQLAEIILSETSAIGLRWRREERMLLPREAIIVTTRLGAVAAKRISTPTGVVVTPEYEDCRRVAAAQQVPLRAVYAACAAAIPNQVEPGHNPIHSREGESK
ncbi:MAG: nickel pincer cofactor biosynthesis protein LarC [Desulfobulbaceae bacterium]|nr:nickel pincer cofactor biosynthesis protein LarC [Desulfobulbaceae bacterium]